MYIPALLLNLTLLFGFCSASAYLCMLNLIYTPQKDAALFFRFVCRRNRLKGAWFKKQGKDSTQNARALEKLSHNDNISEERYWEYILQMIEADEQQLATLLEDQRPVQEFEVITDDSDWAQRVRKCEWPFLMFLLTPMSTLSHTFDDPQLKLVFRNDPAFPPSHRYRFYLKAL